MANKDYYATVKLYYAPFKADERLIFDSADYLENVCTLRKEVEGFQYVRGAIETTIKVNIGATNQDYPKPIWNRAYVNYAYIETVSEYPSDGTRASNKYCYFISKIEQIDMDTLKLYLTLDTLNTLAIMQNGSNNIPWSPRTHVLREHKDRFMLTNVTGEVFPKIDKHVEGINTQKSLDTTIPHNGSRWYLIYRTEYSDAQTSNNPLRLYIISEDELTFKDPSAIGIVTINKSAFEVDKWYICWDNDVQYTISGVTYSNHPMFVHRTTDNKLEIGHLISSGDTNLVRQYDTRDTNAVIFNKCKSLSLYPTYSPLVILNRDVPTLPVNAGQVNYTLKKISQIDRTDSRLVKIVQLPYQPMQIAKEGDLYIVPNGWRLEENMLTTNAETLLENPIFNVVSSGYTIDPEYKRVDFPTNLTEATSESFRSLRLGYEEEPKLFSSEFTLHKFVFDSFYYELPMEYYRVNELDVLPVGYYPEQIEITFYPSINISSTYMFKIIPMYGDIRSNSDYEGFLTVKRNNEVPIFTNAYINYIRSGYNFDIKSKEMQLKATVAETIISAIGATISFASSGVTGPVGVLSGVSFAGNLIKSGISLGTQQASAELNMAQKIQQLQQQGSSVSGADELDLLQNYSPVLFEKIYRPIPSDLNNVINTLRLTGYATNEYKVPNTHTRLYYNHVQCDAEFEMSTQSSKLGPNAEIYESVKNLFKEGVTFMHNPNNAGYDIEMNYENYELSLLGE